MYQATKPPQVDQSGLALLSYDSGVKFVFQSTEALAASDQQNCTLCLAKVILVRPLNLPHEMSIIKAELGKGVILFQESQKFTKLNFEMHMQDVLALLGNPNK
mmetsp:Transcript_3994/g.5064  ORF Transcript_3994/g.5064 Transcript_3994/m.5064 type:complete len:103 (+) Transcript_3994:403-711(+)